jgi:hypothetical protein
MITQRLTPMTPKEAARFGIPESERVHLRGSAAAASPAGGSQLPGRTKALHTHERTVQ